jgi:hypothetical protein
VRSPAVLIRSAKSVIQVVTVAAWLVVGGKAALTGRIGRHSTAGLAVVAAARLMVAQRDDGVGDGHSQLRSERGVVGGPVGEEGLGASPRSVMMLCHDAYTTAGGR